MSRESTLDITCPKSPLFVRVAHLETHKAATPVGQLGHGKGFDNLAPGSNGNFRLWIRVIRVGVIRYDLFSSR